MSLTKVKRGVSEGLLPEVATIADLTAIASPENGMSVTVTDTDRGGLFVFDTSATAAGNSGTTFKADDATTGSWVRQYSGAVMLEWFGATNGGDATSALETAISISPAKISVKEKMTLTMTAVNVDLRAAGVDHPSMAIDFKGSTITKTGAWTVDMIRTSGIVDLRVRNVTLDADSKAARAWYHLSERNELVGDAIFESVHAKNCLQTTSEVAAGIRVAGAMNMVDVVGGSVVDITADAGVGSKITRGVLTGTNYALLGQVNFPRLSRCRGVHIARITPSDDGDGFFHNVDVNAPQKERSIMVAENCSFEDCAKRSIKSQSWNTEIRGNTFRHTGDAPTGSGHEEISFQFGGGVIEHNTAIYSGVARPFLFDGRYFADTARTVVAYNRIELSSALSRLIDGGEFISNGDFHPGIFIIGNEVIGASIAQLLDNRNGSRTSGLKTNGLIVVENNTAEITTALIELERGPSVAGDASAFYGLIEGISIEGNVNLGSSVPYVVEASTNITWDYLNLGANKNFDTAFLTKTVQEDGRVIDTTSGTEVFEDFLYSGANPFSIEVSAVVSGLGSAVRTSYWKGYLRIESGVITEYPSITNTDGNVGGFSFSLLTSPTRLRVTKAAGSGTTNTAHGFIHVRRW